MFTAALLAAPAGGAFAQTMEGCDARVMDAMQATAQARVAHAKAVADQVYDQDDSVLALTCFNQAAGVAAERAGQIFSGDFSAQLAPVIEDALAAMYTGNFADSIGFKTGAVNYDVNAVRMSNVFDCSNPGNLWKQVNDEGVNQFVPYATFDDLLNGEVADPDKAGNSYLTSWNSPSSQDAFADMREAVDALPVPSIPDFSDATTPCEVLLAAGAIPGPCE